MSRSGYSDDLDQWDLIRWRGAVHSAIGGKRGQHFMRELLADLDAMSVKRLIANKLESDADVCALGCIGRARGIDQSSIDPGDSELVAKTFGIAPAMVKEIVFMNDDWYVETPEARWTRMRTWVAAQIRNGNTD